jgi:hypothetical protein
LLPFRNVRPALTARLQPCRSAPQPLQEAGTDRGAGLPAAEQRIQYRSPAPLRPPQLLPCSTCDATSPHHVPLRPPQLLRAQGALVQPCEQLHDGELRGAKACRSSQTERLGLRACAAGAFSTAHTPDPRACPQPIQPARSCSSRALWPSSSCARCARTTRGAAGPQGRRARRAMQIVHLSWLRSVRPSSAPAAAARVKHVPPLPLRLSLCCAARTSSAPLSRSSDALVVCCARRCAGALQVRALGCRGAGRRAGCRVARARLLRGERLEACGLEPRPARTRAPPRNLPTPPRHPTICPRCRLAPRPPWPPTQGDSSHRPVLRAAPQVHGDVFRPPTNSSVLASYFGQLQLLFLGLALRRCTATCSARPAVSRCSRPQWARACSSPCWRWRWVGREARQIVDIEEAYEAALCHVQHAELALAVGWLEERDRHPHMGPELLTRPCCQRGVPASRTRGRLRGVTVWPQKVALSEVQTMDPR